MAAPTPSAFVQAAGRRLSNGYQTTITFAADTNVSFWYGDVTPPGIDGGEPIMLKTQNSTEWRMKSPQRLKEVTDSTAVVGYDPAVTYAEVADLVNVETTITYHYPDGSQMAFYGYLRSFAPSAMTDGAEPEATITIVATNRDPETCAEEGPVWVEGTGTGPC
jgi:hypothetical protein